jgi:pimeloyl-ACP methyl ester carboxylesterase
VSGAMVINLIILELRGQGKTQLSSECATMDQHLHDMKAIFDLLNLDKFHLIGFSFGGRVGLAYASNYPDSVVKLSISCVPLVRSALGKNILESWKESLLVGNLREAAWSIVINSYSDRFHDKIGPRISNLINIIVDTNEPKKLYNLIHLSNVSNENDPLSISNCIKHVNFPVQIIAGKSDRIASFDSVFDLYICIKENSKHPVFFEIQNSGHSIPFEDPVIWQTNIIEFFKTDC